LEACSTLDDEKAQSLLLKKVPEFGFSTPLQIAVTANDLDFVSQRCCQHLLIKLWFNRIMPDTNKYVFYVSMFFPFIAPALVDMGSRRKRSQEMANSESINDYGNDDGSDGDSEDDEDYGYIVKDDEIRSSAPHINNNQFDSSSKEHLHVENEAARGKAKKKSISLYLEFFANIYHFIRTPIVKFFYHQVSLLFYYQWWFLSLKKKMGVFSRFFS
jgi:hypothetical protein